MTKRMLAALLAATLLAALACPTVALASDAGTISSSTLVSEPKMYDGKVVTFEGEAIGEAMVRGADAWIHLNDDAYKYKNVEEGAKLGGYNSGMAIWVPKELAGKISTFGDYKHEGDIVNVTGTFNAACGEHGGDMDIHATALSVTAPGRDAADPVKPWKIPLAAVLTLGAAGLWYADRRVTHRERRGMHRRAM